MQENLKGFFALTRGKKGEISLYRISVEEGRVVVEKIALAGESKVGVGGRLKNGNLLGITAKDGLVLYDGGASPDDSSRMERPEEVNTIFWGGHTSPIVALFFTEAAASACFASADLAHWDPRWQETQLVLEAIGEDHRYFVLSRFPEPVLVERRVRSLPPDESFCGSLTERC